MHLRATIELPCGEEVMSKTFRDEASAERWGIENTAEGNSCIITEISGGKFLGEKQVSVRVYEMEDGSLIYEVGGSGCPWGEGTLTKKEWKQIKKEFKVV